MRRSDDGCLLKKKQQQWAKEKEEATDGWFPFGSPGGGNPNRKHVARDYNKTAEAHSTSPENVPPSSAQAGGARDEGSRERRQSEGAQNDYSPSLPHLPPPSLYGNPPPQPPLPFAYPPYPHLPPDAYHQPQAAQGSLPYPYGLPYPPQSMPYPHYGVPLHLLPSGTIPIPIAPPTTLMTSSMTERWAAQVPEWQSRIEELGEETSSCAPIIHESAAPSLVGGSTVATATRGELPHAYVAPMVATASSTTVVFPAGPLNRSNSFCYDEKKERYMDGSVKMNEEDVYAAQIEERRRLEEEREEKERREEERIRRERREREEAARRMEAEKELEEKKRAEERDRAERAVLEALKKAEEEAKLMKKMRLHKHALQSDIEKEKEMLGVEDEKKLRELEREVNALERAKRLEQEEIARNAPPKEEREGRSTGRQSSSIRSPSVAFDYSSSSSIPSPSSPSPFRRTGSLVVGRRASSGQAPPRPPPSSSSSIVPPSRPTVTPSTVSRPPSGKQPVLATVSPFARNAKSRYSLRAPSSPALDHRPVLPSAHPVTVTPRSATSALRTPTYANGRTGITRPPLMPKPILRDSSKPREPEGQCMGIEGREERREEESWLVGGKERRGDSTGRSNDEDSSLTSRVDDPIIGMDVLRREEEERRRDPLRERGNRREEGRGMDGGRRQEERPRSKSQIPIPLPRLMHDPREIAQPTSAANPLFSPIPTRARRMRMSKEGSGYRREDSLDSASVTSNESGSDSTTSEMRRIEQNKPSIPSIQIEADDTDAAPVKVFTPRFSSRPCTPSGQRAAGTYADRLKELGGGGGGGMAVRKYSDSLAPSVQPRPPTELAASLSESMRSLRMSINNLSNANSGGTPPPECPGLSRFNSRSTQYRSFNTKRADSEKQQQVLERLSTLRASIRKTQAFRDRPMSRQGSTLNVSGQSSRLPGDATSP